MPTPAKAAGTVVVVVVVVVVAHPTLVAATADHHTLGVVAADHTVARVLARRRAVRVSACRTAVRVTPFRRCRVVPRCEGSTVRASMPVPASVPARMSRDPLGRRSIARLRRAARARLIAPRSIGAP